MIKLRDYQQQAINDAYQEIKQGNNRNVIKLQTGAGKSVVIKQIIEDFLAHDYNVVIVMRRRTLVNQMSNHLKKWNFAHGVYMASHARYIPRRSVQVCSIDTLNARSKYPHSDKEKTIVIIDEAHDCTPSNKSYCRLIEAYKFCKIFGLTATPYSDMSLWDSITESITGFELMERGFLVPEKTYVPNQIDTTGIKKSAGDFNNKQLFEVASQQGIVGDIVRDWKKYGEQRRTILFAVNVEHSKILCREFNEQGIPALHCDADTPENERVRALDMLRQKKISVLSNVNIFSTGLDVVEIECVQFARPTMSVNYWLQAVGRGLRPASHIGKENCIIIDNAGNTLRHGTPYMHRNWTTEKPERGSKRSKEEGELSIVHCQECFYIYESELENCPACGTTKPKRERKIKQTDGELVEFNLSPEEIAKIKINTVKTDFHKLTTVARIKGFHINWAYKRLVKKHGVELCLKSGIKVPEKIAQGMADTRPF